MFNIINLNKSYTSKLGYRSDILKGISVQLPKKGVVFVLGKSGSGKTTLLNLLGGMDDFKQGDIQIYNNSFLNFKNNDYDNYRNSMVGFVFQDFNLISDLTVGQNISLSLELQGTKSDPSVINEILTSVELSGLETRKINELSGGQRQRVAIARAFIKKTDVVFCDEPTGNLDSETTEVIFNFLKKMSQEKLIVVITHDKENAFKFGDRVIEIKDGQIISDLSKSAELQAKNKKNNKLDDLKGQVLTEEMLKSIAQKMESDSNSYQKFFIPTSAGTPEKIETIPLNNVKSRLSSSLAFKMGTSLFKEKKVFLFVTLLISTILYNAFATVLVPYILYLDFKFMLIPKGEKLLKANSIANQSITQNSLRSLQNSLKDIENIFQNIMLIIFVIILLQSFFMIGGFVKRTIKFQKKDIGVLRSLGARRTDVLKIFLTEGFVISFLISCLLLICVTIPFDIVNWSGWLKNNIIFKEFDKILSDKYIAKIQIEPKDVESYKKFINEFINSFKFWSNVGFVILIVTIINLFITFISIFYPIWKFSRKKPIEIILDK